MRRQFSFLYPLLHLSSQSADGWTSLVVRTSPGTWLAGAPKGMSPFLNYPIFALQKTELPSVSPSG